MNCIPLQTPQPQTNDDVYSSSDEGICDLIDNVLGEISIKKQFDPFDIVDDLVSLSSLTSSSSQLSPPSSPSLPSSSFPSSSLPQMPSPDPHTDSESIDLDLDDIDITSLPQMPIVPPLLSHNSYNQHRNSILNINVPITNQMVLSPNPFYYSNQQCQSQSISHSIPFIIQPPVPIQQPVPQRLSLVSSSAPSPLSSSDAIIELSAILREKDENNDDYIDREEFIEALNEIDNSMLIDDIHDIYYKLINDNNSNSDPNANELSISKFIQYLIKKKHSLSIINALYSTDRIVDTPKSLIHDAFPDIFIDDRDIWGVDNDDDDDDDLNKDHSFILSMESANQWDVDELNKHERDMINAIKRLSLSVSSYNELNNIYCPWSK